MRINKKVSAQAKFKVTNWKKKYRKLSGCNFHVLYQDIIGSKKNLLVRNIIKKSINSFEIRNTNINHLHHFISRNLEVYLIVTI